MSSLFTSLTQSYPNRRTLEYVLCFVIKQAYTLVSPYHRRHFFMNLQLLIKSSHSDKQNSFKVRTWKGLRLPQFTDGDDGSRNYRSWEGKIRIKKISLARADIILIIIIILSQKNICDSEIVLFSFFFNHDRFVLYVFCRDSEFLDISEALCGKQRGVSRRFILLTSRFGLIILIYYNIDLDQVPFSQNYPSNSCMLITLNVILKVQGYGRRKLR